MGVFISMIEGTEAEIPDGQKEAFVNGILEIFRQGGMFTTAFTTLHGYTVRTLEWPRIDRRGVCDVTYNWYENDGWENAGLNISGAGKYWERRDRNRAPSGPDIYSGKVGSSSFCDVMMAAYTLRMLLLDGPSALFLEDIRPEVPKEYAQWIAALLPSVNTSFFPDLWQTFAALSDPDDPPKEEYWEDRMDAEAWDTWCRNHMHRSLSCFISAGEIISVLRGTDAWLHECTAHSIVETLAEETTGELFLAAAQNLKAFRESSPCTDAEQLDLILDAWKARCSDDRGLQEAGFLPSLIQSLYILDAPAYGVKLLSEAYDRPFWDFWHALPESIRRRHSKTQVRPVSTSRFFGCRDDDRIPWWTPEKNYSWSRYQKVWFRTLRERHDELVAKSTVAFTLDAVLELLTDVYQDRFGRARCFQSFLDETMADLKNPHIQASWQQLAEMMNDPDPDKAACNAFPYILFPVLTIMSILRMLHARMLSGISMPALAKALPPPPV